MSLGMTFAQMIAAVVAGNTLWFFILWGIKVLDKDEQNGDWRAYPAILLPILFVGLVAYTTVN